MEKHSLAGLDGQRDIQLIKILWSLWNIHGEGEESISTKQSNKVKDSSLLHPLLFF